MFIIDYQTDSYKSDVLTEQKATKECVLRFCLHNSIDHSKFKVIRISKYEYGRLVPYEVKIDQHYRITLEELRQEPTKPVTPLQAQRGELF